MIDAVTVTLIILAVVLLRRPLLTDPDAAPGVREDGEDNGFTARVPVPVRTTTPHPVWIKRYDDQA
ncbi:hypothetical protein LF599_16505 [Pseudodesulfovibrio thermohalotolerans]|uniref:hypothetical protein n=1 Tax=Pseudodesulfovibrio thermohalotolerans TaxID=2880651 RepID=UPI0024428053|nr:hypothetical protein [Pseudodesulfovibrio thermohalotolerans]WFS62242.1 hypothetical protein LF599_16505 [Pseudodesulfovibrio thermohalotolerans]